MTPVCKNVTLRSVANYPTPFTLEKATKSLEPPPVTLRSG
jgi:hypothetical protein